MSYSRGRFGIEYQPAPVRERASWLPPVLLIIFLVVAVSLIVTLVGRVRRSSAEAKTDKEAVEVAVKLAEPRTAAPVIQAPPPPQDKIEVGENRPTRAKVLLMRLKEAEESGDVEKQVSTIEQIRSLPNLVADQDDKLAKRLGQLNLKLLFEGKSPRWCTVVKVKRGENATRIARTYGSTLASVQELNGDVSTVREGQQLTVMNHPHFSLAVYRLTKTADLSLNDRFFKRYYLPVAPTGSVGSYETTARPRQFFAEIGLTLDVRDRAELEKLLPPGTPVIISEFR